MMLTHGGDLEAAQNRWGGKLEDWVDLSTGISPIMYPYGEIPAYAFQQMPYERESFRESVVHYYGNHPFVATNGSQQAISLLPLLLNGDTRLPVLLPSLGYAEHRKAWEHMGCAIRFYDSFDHDQAFNDIKNALILNPKQHLLVINPNNPTGLMFSPDQLRAWAAQLEGGAHLIVDEAFIDLTPDQSLMTQALSENIVVLRSFGKFFGMPGLRLGFCFGSEKFIEQFKTHLNPWEVNGVAQHIAEKAFWDDAWQNLTRTHLETLAVEQFASWDSALRSKGGTQIGQTSLYSTYSFSTSDAKSIYQHLGEQKILVRFFDLGQQTLIRFGLSHSSISDTKFLFS